MPSKSPLLLKVLALSSLLFLHVPLFFIVLYAFSSDDKTFTFPLPGLTLQWFSAAWERQDIWDALSLSLRVAALATLSAVVLGTLAAAAVHKTRGLGKEIFPLLLILPIALPGIVTGMAIRASLSYLEIPFSFFTIVVGHATFCIVVVYNNAIARLRRTSSSLVEASYDLGANSLQTFRYVILPSLGTALLAGSMLAFALSFDEVIVTTFTAGQQTTLPIWMLNELVRPRQRPVTNVVAVGVMMITLIPILAAHLLTREKE